jgi:hypothetical protein
MANAQENMQNRFGNTGGVLSYPSDIGSDRSKYYIMFFANAQDRSTQASIDFGSTAYSTTPTGPLVETNNASVQRAATRRAVATIALYMPNAVEVTHKSNYGEAEISLAVASALGALKGSAEGFDYETLLETAKAEANTLGASILEGVGVTGAKAAMEITQGKVTNNRTEMKFESIDRRSFSFTFKMLPKDAQEARSIEEIVTLFRYHSMPEFEGSNALGRTMIIPSTFNIQYMGTSAIHYIGECALESVNVKYGGERPQFFRDGQPVETELTLQFKELDLITKEEVARGF